MHGTVDVGLNILDLGTKWRRVVSYMPRPIYSRGKTHGTHRIEGCVVPRAVLCAAESRDVTCSCWKPNPRHPACSPSLQDLNYDATKIADHLDAAKKR
jgi:hypothetical protein